MHKTCSKHIANNLEYNETEKRLKYFSKISKATRNYIKAKFKSQVLRCLLKEFTVASCMLKLFGLAVNNKSWLPLFISLF